MTHASPTRPRFDADAPPRPASPTRLWRFLLRLSRFLVPMFCRVRIVGEPPHQTRTGPVILVANHIGTFDPFVLIVACAKVGLAPRFLATRGIFNTPVVGTVMHGCGHIPVDRGKNTVTDALHHAADALADGACLLMYPEGKISLDPGLWPQRGKTGAARLALSTKAPVVTVAQWGAHEVMAWQGAGTMAANLVSALWRRPIVTVAFGDVIDFDDYDTTDPASPKLATARIISHCTKLLRTLRPNEPHQPRHIDVSRPLSVQHSVTDINEPDAS